MNNGPTGPVHPDWEVIQGEAYYVNRVSPGADYLHRLPQSFVPPPHPFPHCDCTACEVRRLKAQVDTLTQERDAARAEHQRWLDEAWKRGQFQAGANKEKLNG